MHICNENVKILNDLPIIKTFDGKHYKECVEYKSMVGMILNIEYYKTTYENIKILEYIKGKSSKFKIEYNGNIKYISCDHFKTGKLGSILNEIIWKEGYICNNKGDKILSKIPYNTCGRHRNRVNFKSMIGLELKVQYHCNIYEGINIIDVILNSDRYYFVIKYKDNIYATIDTYSFMRGNFSGFLGVQFIDLNNKYIDDEGVVHIHIKNTKGEEFEALYSGNHVEEVMSCNWNVGMKNNNISNVLSNTKLLHHFDYNPPTGYVVDHINNNPLDNRIENLRVVTHHKNSKNKNTRNKFNTTGLNKNHKGYLSKFKYNENIVFTKTKINLEEARLDNLIAQRYLGYKHNEDLFYLLDDLSEERIKEVTDWLDKKIENNKNKILKVKEYNHDIEEKDGYYILHKNGKEMLFDCDLEFIKNMRFANKYDYWSCFYIANNKNITNLFHRELLGLNPNQYQEYRIQIDHLNNIPNDNRRSNLMITTIYSNLCNKIGKGYIESSSKTYRVTYMCNYRFFNELIKVLKVTTFKTESEAIAEVGRRREIVDKARVKLHSKQELDDLIQYCLENGYIQENGLADLDLGYLYWKGVL